MDHDQLVETIRTVVEIRQAPDVSRRPEDYGLDAIAAPPPPTMISLRYAPCTCSVHTHRAIAKGLSPSAVPNAAPSPRPATPWSMTASPCPPSPKRLDADPPGCTGSSVSTTCDPNRVLATPPRAAPGHSRSVPSQWPT